ncbi:hypothetical protein BDQ17DRAFT_1440642 [Cyathus striatus]|nr:hypothetical protein BDQ17DRAFT_1440642 [Cyathus striatus]
MGRHSKSTINCLSNLTKGSGKPKESCSTAGASGGLQVTVEEVVDSEDDEYTPGYVSDDFDLSDSEELDPEEDEAQKVALKAQQKAAELKPKWKKHYTGNAVRTKQWWASKQCKIAEAGSQLFISWFFNKKDMVTKPKPTSNTTDTLSIKPVEHTEAASMERKAAEAHIKELAEMRHHISSSDTSPVTESEQLLQAFSSSNRAALLNAKLKLTIKSNAKIIDLFFRKRIMAIV